MSRRKDQCVHLAASVVYAQSAKLVIQGARADWDKSAT